MKANKLDGLQCSNNNFGGGDVTSNVLYEPRGKLYQAQSK